MPNPPTAAEWARRGAQAVELPSCTCDQLPDDGQFHAFCTNHARMAKAIEESAVAYARQHVSQALGEFLSAHGDSPEEQPQATSFAAEVEKAVKRRVEAFRERAAEVVDPVAMDLESPEGAARLLLAAAIRSLEP